MSEKIHVLPKPQEQELQTVKDAILDALKQADTEDILVLYRGKDREMHVLTDQGDAAGVLFMVEELKFKIMGGVVLSPQGRVS